MPGPDLQDELQQFFHQDEDDLKTQMAEQEEELRKADYDKSILFNTMFNTERGRKIMALLSSEAEETGILPKGDPIDATALAVRAGKSQILNVIRFWMARGDAYERMEARGG